MFATGMKNMTPSLVTPGTHVSTSAECEAGEGTIEIDGKILATTTGMFSIEEGMATVSAAREIVTPEIGDTVLCEIVKLNEKNGEAQVICVEGKPGSVLPEHLYGQFHVTGIVDRYMHQTADAVRRRDVCRAEVKENSPVLRISFRDRDDCGVLHAICPPCGDVLVADLDGDWNVRCPTCNHQSYRALADNYGAGWAELDQGASALNNSGKRWGAAAEAMFAKGPSGRATFIAADVREDGRERTYFRFEGESGDKGRRPRNAPGCRLFIGGLPREVGTEELRALFAEHGDMTDCIVLTDDNGVNRGFGFVTYSDKSHADAAIAKLNGHKINGRKIGVRDADSDDKKGKREKRKDPEGLKLYIGNLPFKATEDNIKAMFDGIATVNGLVIATSGDGKPKGFAFAFIKEMDKGDEIVSKLNGSELLGRRIKVDISQGGKKGGNNRGKRGGDGNADGKSSRELQALREEEEDAKKRPRRRRDKKD
ncbi:MAG: exosome complex RNA-binding protein Csl4 [Euryarchaeota archaeon]|jgi:RNA recognition motif-containing protein/exosome complex RNA-binding protein Csl4|nr:exosome complex RNA-binding protein Csl4 [Euryarchaeota archaeon]MBT7063642.1 exosome complex RNA-binding protein Csl4 [Euryarchaeota archaeon]MBT7637986.1 exosome complex RNA-binding protein Csl4 [Euryarchaeota archaeon]